MDPGTSTDCPPTGQVGRQVGMAGRQRPGIPTVHAQQPPAPGFPRPDTARAPAYGRPAGPLHSTPLLPSRAGSGPGRPRILLISRD